MNDSKCARLHSGCPCSEDVRRNPEECTPEQIAECHPEAKEHPCIENE